MPRYKVLTKSFINDQLMEKGREVEFAGEPGDNLEPLDDAARAAVAAARQRRADKAAALAVGASAHASKEQLAQMASLIDRVAAVEKRATDALASFEARLAAFEATVGPAPDLSGFAKASDVTELDAGLQIVSGRVDEIEGTLAELAKTPPAPPAEPAPG